MDIFVGLGLEFIPWFIENAVNRKIPKIEVFVVIGAAVVSAVGSFLIFYSPIDITSPTEIILSFFVSLLFGVVVFGIGSAIVRGKHYIEDIGKWK